MNTDYGIYPESVDGVVMEAVDRNTEYEQQVLEAVDMKTVTKYEEQAAGGEEACGMSDYENWEEEYDKMYEDQVDERENQENDHDKMYVLMGGKVKAAP